MRFKEYLNEARITLKTVNKKLKNLGWDIELNKGNGYFYFFGDDVEPGADGIYVNKLNDLPLETWIEEAKERLKDKSYNRKVMKNGKLKL